MDEPSIFEAAGFKVPKAAPKTSSRSGSIFEEAGFKLPGKRDEPAEAPPAAPMPPGAARAVTVPGGGTSYVDASGKFIDPPANPRTDTLVERARDVSGFWPPMAEAFRSSRETAGQGLKDIASGLSARGVGETVLGGAGILAFPMTGAINALVEQPASKMGGNELSSRAGAVAGLAVPGLLGGKAAAAAMPSNRAINQLVEAIGPENVPAAVNRLRANPQLSPVDVSDPVRLRAQGLIDPAQPRATDIITGAVDRRMSEAPAAINSAYDRTLGPSPDTQVVLKGLKDRAQRIGREQIGPALAGAKPVDVSPVIEAIDAELRPGMQAFAKSGLPLSPAQEALARFRQQLTAENGETLVDAQRLHLAQSRAGREAFEYMHSPNPQDRLTGRAMRDINEKLVDAIDAASKGNANPVPKEFRGVQLQTPTGKTDATGIWFLRGDKPVFSNSDVEGARLTLGDAADELKKYPSVSGRNADGYLATAWYKPGERARAEKTIETFKKGYPSDPSDVAGQIQYHLDHAEGLGYSKQAAENYVRSRFGREVGDEAVNKVLGAPGPGPYRQARAKFAEAKDIDTAFQEGFDVLKNRSGYEGLRDRPEALRDRLKIATPEERYAMQVGVRSDIDQKINGVRSQVLGGTGITKIPYNREKLEMLFGKDEAGRLVRAMEDASDISATNQKLVQGSKTAETQAAQRAMKVREVGGGNPLSYVAPVAAELLGQSAGFPFVGLAGTTALKGAHLGFQKIGQMSDLARNTAFARAATASGPAREELINRLVSHPKVVRALKKSGNQLTTTP